MLRLRPRLRAALDVGIVNIFEPAQDADVIVFPETGFTADACMINGRPARLAEHARTIELDVSRPLITEMCGERINTSFQDIDAETGTVRFYAPVVAGLKYRQAAPVDDYAEAFGAEVQLLRKEPLFHCNCILNFLFGGFENVGSMAECGPATFGEIAYLLLNQTLVYMEHTSIDRISKHRR